MLDLDQPCSLNWELDGHEVVDDNSSASRGRTRRIHVQWEQNAFSDAYLVFKAPELYPRANSDSRGNWDDDFLFLGRSIDHRQGNRALMKSWLSLCQIAHSGPCRAARRHLDAYTDLIRQSFFGIIDIRNKQLRPLKPNTSYIALSYIWGNGPRDYVTTKDNVILRRTHGGLEPTLKDLPRVISDAIDLVDELGFDHLWVDSLCIVQDSPQGWTQNAEHMDLIYGNAALIICAADGDASTGLLAMHPKNCLAISNPRRCAPAIELMVSRPPETSTTPFAAEASSKYPDLPILQFWTYYTTLIIGAASHGYDSLPEGFRRYEVFDHSGDWCGSFVANSLLAAEGAYTEQSFIAVSEAHSFTKDECEIWNYYIPKEKHESEWDLYFVLLIRFTGNKWERVALGKVFKKAFNRCEWKEIVLA